MSWGKDEPSLLNTGPSLQYFKKGADGCVMLLCLLLIEVVAYTKRGQRLLVSSSKMFNWSLFLSFLSNFNFFLSAYFIFLKNHPYAVSFCQLGTSPTYLGRGNLSWWIASMKLACGHACEAFLLITDWCGKMQPTVGGVTPEQVGLGYKDSLTSPWAALLPGHCSVPAWSSCLLLSVNCKE